ncbi:MAG: hypothetical protein JJE49_10050 [Peptostreptococcaceae bacterium]|nr:hypothetical protein [Peptostreptococcaceae bacterium]
MNRSDKILAFEGIEIDLLRGSLKNKEITKLFITGMTYKEIGEMYRISSSRVGQITDRQARIANFYKKMQNNLEYQGLVKFYLGKVEINEAISISSESNVSEHMMALEEARKRLEEIRID